jgi:hypothetical protein
MGVKLGLRDYLAQAKKVILSYFKKLDGFMEVVGGPSDLIALHPALKH